MTGWTRKKRGWSHVHTHPDVEGAIVDGRGYGLNPGVRHRGTQYATVEAAKADLMEKVNAPASNPDV